MMCFSFARSRPALAGLVIAAVGLTGCAASPAPTRDVDGSSSPPSPGESIESGERFAELEKRFGARLGVFAVDTGTGSEVSWRDDERFAYASTFKAMAAAAVLDQVGIDGLQKPISVEAADIVAYSPVTEKQVGGTMTLGEVAEAAVTVSDNTLGNYLFAELGGPSGLDEALSALGDDTTVMARTETGLNEALPGDDRDTTTPRAFAVDLREYVLGDTLSEDEAAQLKDWLTATRTGDTLVRADLPADWLVGDKSGSGGYGTRNDIAVVWPTDGAPIVIAVMSSREEQDAAYDDRLIAEAAAAAVEALT